MCVFSVLAHTNNFKIFCMIVFAGKEPFGDGIAAGYSSTSCNPLDEGLSCRFDWEAYRSSLKAQNYGQIVVYGDVLTSTMNVFDG